MPLSSARVKKAGRVTEKFLTRFAAAWRMAVCSVKFVCLAKVNQLHFQQLREEVMSQRSVICLRTFCLSLAVMLSALLAWMLTGDHKVIGQTANSTGNQELSILEFGQPVERELTVGQDHNFGLELKVGQFVKVEVEQLGIDVIVKLFGLNGMNSPPIDWEPWGHGKETIYWQATASGRCRIQLTAPRSTTRTGKYVVRVSELKEPDEKERGIAKADRLYVQISGHFEARNHKEGIPLAEQALALRESLFPADHPAISEAVRQLMYMLELREDYNDVPRRLKLSDRILQIRERALGADHPEVARWLHNMALASDLAQSPRLFQRALDILEKNYGPDHPDVGFLLSNYAIHLDAKGDHLGAEAMWLRAIAIREKVSSADSNLAQSLNNLGDLYAVRGDYERAEMFLRRALYVWTCAHGTWAEQTSHAIGNLADLYRRKRDFANAEKFMKQGLEIRQTVLSPTTLLTGQFHHGLGVIYLEMGDYVKAEQSLQQADAIFKNYLVWTNDYLPLSLAAHVRLSLAMGQNNEALAYLQRAVPFSESKLNTVLVAGSEQDKLNFLNEFAVETNQALSLHARYLPNDPQAMQLAFNTWLQRKGRALDEMNRTIALMRQFAKGNSAELIEQWTNKVRQISAVATAAGKDDGLASRSGEIEKLYSEFQQLQARMSEHSAQFRTQVLPPVRAEDVRAALPSESVLIEFAQYQPSDPRTNKKSPARYLAYVLPKEGKLRGIDLGEVAKIDAAVLSFRQTISDKDFRTDPRLLARKLDQLLMRRIRPLLGQAKTIFVAPDGELNLVPFAALRDDRGRYLIEDYLFVYLTSGRDLLRLQIKHQSQSDKLIFAINDFGEKSGIASPIAKTGSSIPPSLGFDDARSNRLSADTTMATLQFDSLKYTHEEANAVQRIFPEARPFLDAQAMETALKQVHRPYFLHLATHGFFLANASQKWENPLLRSGLAMAGANVRKSGNDDGILTAFEVAALDLWGTKLVVLSACETGNGEVKNGEGVFGLRRALVLAGAETQVSSLWKADDLVTRKLMEKFYGNLNKGMGRAEALRKAQLEILRGSGSPAPYYWANFICIGEWKPLEK